MNHRHGFTLIELLISIAILGMISVGVYTTTSSTFILREKLQAEAEFYNLVRSSLSIIERDILMIYSPQLAALPGALGQAAPPVQPGTNPNSRPGVEVFDPGIPTKFWGQMVNTHHIRPSRFTGEEGKLSFISASNIRLYRDSKESNFLKIKYSQEDDDLPVDTKKRRGKTLARYTDTNVFVDDGREETEIRTVILREIKSFKLTYLDGRNDQWQNNWDTEGRDTKNRFPALIKLVVEVYQPAPLPEGSTFSVTQVYKPELAL